MICGKLLSFDFGNFLGGVVADMETVTELSGQTMNCHLGIGLSW